MEIYVICNSLKQWKASNKSAKWQKIKILLRISHNLRTEIPVLICEDVSSIGRGYFVPALCKQMYMTMLLDLIGGLAVQCGLD